MNSSYAQVDNHDDYWYMGASGGISFGDVTSASLIYTTTNKNGFQVGGLIGYQFSPEFSMQIEAMMEKRSFRTERYISGFRLIDTSNIVCWECYYAYDVVFTSDYLTFPLVLNYTKAKGDFGLTAHCGLFFSLLLNSNYQGYEEIYLDPVGADSFIAYDFEPGIFKLIFTGPTKDLINTYDAGLLIGLSGKYMLNKSIDLTIESRMQLGFVTLYENPQMPELNNKSLVLRTGIIYKLNRVR